MDDLVRWLGEQLDEDERIARRLLDDKRPGRAERWEFCDDGAIRDTGPHRSLRVKFTWSPEANHIVAHDPARVLREIDAKRRIVEAHRITVEKVDTAPYDSLTGERRPDEYNVTCAICGWSSDDQTSGCLTLRLLALPYADRPGYREEWRL